MAELTFGVARELAAALCTIGHPFQQSFIDATANDLMKWCRGYFAERPIGPEQQAEALIDRARAWPEGWPEKGGTAKLHALFEEMYPAKAVKDAPKFTSEAEAVGRGLLPRPCHFCDAAATWCEHGGARGHKRFLEDRAALPPAPATRKPRAVINLEAILSNGERLYLAEQQRKQQQLGEISDAEIDYRSAS